MGDKPVLHALCARQYHEGWVFGLDLELITLEEAAALRSDDCRYVVLVDPADEAALGAFKRSQMPWNQARWSNGE
jgi:hypothetical protein